MKSAKPNIIRLLMMIMLHNKIHSGKRGDLVVQCRAQERELGCSKLSLP